MPCDLAASSAFMASLLMSIFSPSSPSAQSIVDLSILTFAIAALIFAIVEGILFYCVWRFRRSKHDPEGEPAQVYGSQPIEVAWTAAPAMIAGTMPARANDDHIVGVVDDLIGPAVDLRTAGHRSVAVGHVRSTGRRR